MMDKIEGLCVGLLLFSVLQFNVLPCGTSCKEAFIRNAINKPEWSKTVWEEIGSRLEEEHTK